MRELERLNRPTQKALVIFDVFIGQITDKVLDHFKENNIATVFVPDNMTGQLQPHDCQPNCQRLREEILQEKI